MAHARLAGVDTTAARALPGVVAVLLAADVPDGLVPIRLVFAATPEAESVLQPLLARDVVRYVGEPVALVLADDPWIAEDAAELVELDLDPLPVAADPVTAAELEANVVNSIPTRFGDVAEASAGAAVRIRRRLSVQRHTGVPMETRGLVAATTRACSRSGAPPR